MKWHGTGFTVSACVSLAACRVIPPLFIAHFVSGAGAVGKGTKGLCLAPNYFKLSQHYDSHYIQHKTQDVGTLLNRTDVLFQVVSDAPWYNLSKQQYQPSVTSCLNDRFIEPILRARQEERSTSCVDEEVSQLITTGCIQHYALDAFAGGGCLRISQPCSEENFQR
jgi:hypothetical protein